MKVYFRAVRDSATIYDRVIRWYSRSPYVHVEFCWPLDHPRPSHYLGAQPQGGVGIRPFNYLGVRPFDTFEVEITAEQEKKIYDWCVRQVGKPYDFRAIAGMAFPWLDHGKHGQAFFCSEFVYAALAQAGIFLLHEPLHRADRITPRDVAISPLSIPWLENHHGKAVIGPQEGTSKKGLRSAGKPILSNAGSKPRGECEGKGGAASEEGKPQRGREEED